MAELKTTVVETITRKYVLEVTASDLLRLLMRCKEVPRRAEGNFEVREGPIDDGGGTFDLGAEAALGGDVIATVSWVQEVKPVATAEKFEQSIAAGDEAEARELDESLAEAEAAVKALPKRETVQDLTHPEYVAPLPYGDDE